jgi:prophage regulatory protein
VSSVKTTAIQIIRLPRVLELTGLSRMSIYRFEKAGKFPKRVTLGENAVGWPLSEVEAWLEAAMSRRGGKAA